MYRAAVQSHAAFTKARALLAQLASATDADAVAFKAKLEALAPSSALPRNVRNARRRPAAGAPVHLESVSNAALAAALSMQSADVAPTATQVAAVNAARGQYATVMAAWTALSGRELGVLNAKRKAGGMGEVGVGR